MVITSYLTVIADPEVSNTWIQTSGSHGAVPPLPNMSSWRGA